MGKCLRRIWHDSEYMGTVWWFYDNTSSNNYSSTLRTDQSGSTVGAQCITKGGEFWNDGGHYEMLANDWPCKPDSKSSEISFHICRTILPWENLIFSNIIAVPASLAMCRELSPVQQMSIASCGIDVAGAQFWVVGINNSASIGNALAILSTVSSVWRTVIVCQIKACDTRIKSPSGDFTRALS